MSQKKNICENCQKQYWLPKTIHACFFCTTKGTKDPKEQPYKGFFGKYIVVFRVMSHLVALPGFIVLHRWLPELNWAFKFDRIVLFLLVVIAVEVLYYWFKGLVIALFFLSFALLGYGSIFGYYGFIEAGQDYKTLLFATRENVKIQNLQLSKLRPFHHKSTVLKAIDIDNPIVRDFALMCVNKHFQGLKFDKKLRPLVHALAVFKEINSNWKYVNDPKSRDYFAKASESIRFLSGDCDDHSILMAAAIRSVGGTPRLIHTHNHMYPELKAGKRQDLGSLNQLVRHELFPIESKDKNLNYHIDEQGNIWLNLDYTANYPGGPFMAEEILGALTIE
jgi:hypothetical protein